MVTFDRSSSPPGGAPAENAGVSRADAVLWRVAGVLGVVVLAGGAGFAGGVFSSRSADEARQREASAALEAQDRARAAEVAALAARIKVLEGKPRGEAVVRPAIEILAQRVDEISRAQTAALAQTRSRFERADLEMTQRLDKLIERIERVEKQVSTPSAVGSSGEASSSQMRHSGALGGPIRGYVLREVFRDGGAVVEGRQGLVEIAPGADLPGAGLVRGLERRNGRWVLVTSTGFIETHN